MSLDELIKKPMTRLNPHRGLVIDVPTWSAAHDYHHTYQRLHAMAMHRPGIVTGLEVVGWNPPDSSVVIYPGVAVDKDGYTIIVTEPQRFQVQSREAGTVHLILQYRELPQEMAHSTGDEDAQPTYILETYRLESRMDFPEAAHIELARFQISGTSDVVKDATDVQEPGADEIDLRFRIVSGPRPLGELAIGLVPLESTPDGVVRHQPGAMNLIRNINSTTQYRAEFKGLINLNQEIRDCHVVLMAGQAEFSLTEAWESNLRNYLDRGGVVFGESCGEALKEADQESPFQRSFREMADRLGRPLAPVERRHSLFTAHHLFAGPPEGIDGPAAVFSGNGIIYTDGDYGCLWDGGKPEPPATRSSIRSGIELGVNLAIYSYQRSHTHSVKMAGQ